MKKKGRGRYDPDPFSELLESREFQVIFIRFAIANRRTNYLLPLTFPFAGYTLIVVSVLIWLVSADFSIFSPLTLTS